MVLTALDRSDVESQVRLRVEAELAAELAHRDRTRVRVDDQLWVNELVRRVVGEEQRRALTPISPEESEQLWRRVFAGVTPLGPLAEHLADPDVEEVRINGTESCFVFREGRRHEVDPPFGDETALIELVHWYTDGTPSARLDRASPTVTMTLPEGSRLHAALSPPARPMCVTIRRHPPARFRDLESLAGSGFLPRQLIAFLEAAVAGRLNILIAGGAGAGKTTFMRVLARLIAPEERVVTIEDQSELHLWRELRDCISLEGRPPNTEGRGAITIQMLVHEALRMSPDRIIIGEVRGGEALDLLDAMNTGHPGSICTIHADSPRDTLPRLARVALRNPQAPRVEAVLAEVVHTVDLVLFAGLVRGADSSGSRGRKLLSLGCVGGLDDGRPAVQELVRFGQDGRWHLVGSPAAMPERIRAKLAEICDPLRLLDAFDA
ncbi:MAG: Flp pilus assembly complex ATPase component TadA [Candidatus Dormibacteraeota bacterium]|nr:Flp pilus assembly complex ATPase component TadA [Candidatus Dormibacteraeota bacterium]